MLVGHMLLSQFAMITVVYIYLGKIMTQYLQKYFNKLITVVIISVTGDISPVNYIVISLLKDFFF